MQNDPNEEKYHTLIKSYFQDTSVYRKYSFKSMFRKQIESIARQFMNIIVYCFRNYSEEDFHRRMRNKYVLTIKSRDGKEPDRKVTLEGFDFLGDWRTHHKYKFAFFIKAVRAQKDNFIFDEEKIYETLMALMDAKGWTLTQQEKESIKVTVRRLYNVLYLGWDSCD